MTDRKINPAEYPDLHFSNEACYACRHSIGTTSFEMYGTSTAGFPNNGALLYCRVRKTVATDRGWDCLRFDREPGADYPSEMNEKTTAVFISPHLIRLIKSGYYLENRPSREEIRREEEIRNT